ncbi:TIGR01777 family oxidoreductase [Bacillus sp. T33-2]|uniref:TIGR01777 family oxidoreductase n=1 Tax=Bacillus sp. T33-2 TaxID=2054168 RepID=UPI000C78B65B|nr:TIGR01777 family oxidoreductase [Bacillus sp. T33-2]PLR95392.1 TIGR01777 family protein [Bacillus sp. T33-2]
MKIAITGGTGLVGKALTKQFIQLGYEVFILSREAGNKNGQNPRYVQWLNEGSRPERELEGIDAIINLAGATINSRWTDQRKSIILGSRLKAADEVVRIISTLDKKPAVLINASAVGYYGISKTKIFTEQTKVPGDDFLAATVKKWEEAGAAANSLGVRTVFCRFGVILAHDGGALPRMVLPYKLFAGGTVGSGNQWLSWIHLEDVINGILFILNKDKISGSVNFTAPEPVTMRKFGKTVGSVLNRPHWLPVPSFALKTMLGEMSFLVLEGQRVIPEKLLQSGYHFHYPKLEPALADLLVQ